MYQQKLERTALIIFAICLVVLPAFAAYVFVTSSAPTPTTWLVLLSALLTTCTWGILWRDRRRARVAAESRNDAVL